MDEGNGVKEGGEERRGEGIEVEKGRGVREKKSGGGLERRRRSKTREGRKRDYR